MDTTNHSTFVGPQKAPSLEITSLANSHYLSPPTIDSVRGFKLVRCIIYCRVSTDEQASEEHYSLAAQADYGLAEIQKRKNEGWVHVETISDPGFSGFTFERPGLLRLIHMVKARLVDVIIVYKRERLFRNADLAAQVQALFESHGVRVLSSEGLHDYAPHSVLMRQMIDVMAQFERANGRKRAYDCRRFAAKRGDWKGGTPPFGYRLKTGAKTMEFEPEEAKIVKLIFQRAAEGWSPTEIAQELRSLKCYGRPRGRRLLLRQNKPIDLVEILKPSTGEALS